VVSVLAMVAGFTAPAVASTAHRNASVTVDVLHDHVTCDTLIGTIAFATKLTLTGPTTGANTTTVKIAASGCNDDDHPEYTAAPAAPFSGAITGTLSTTGGASCTGLLGPGSATGTTQVVWKNPKGYLFTPTTLVGTAQKPVSSISISQDQGGVFTVSGTSGPWDGTGYGFFSIGADYGTTAPSQTGAANLFKGNDSGATGWFAGTTNQGVGALLAGCGKGLSKVTFGIGALHAG